MAAIPAEGVFEGVDTCFRVAAGLEPSIRPKNAKICIRIPNKGLELHPYETGKLEQVHIDKNRYFTISGAYRASNEGKKFPVHDNL